MIRKVLFVTLTLLAAVITYFVLSNNFIDKMPIDENKTLIVDSSKMTLVLSAPSVHDEYYKPVFQKIVDFQLDYANKILGNDNVRIIVDADTKKYYEDKITKDILISADVYDIWMRDFTTINPHDPVQFAYTNASMSQTESEEVQSSFNIFANKLGLKRKYSSLVLDGGNIVDNYKGRVVTTTRFLKDNRLSYADGKKILKEILNATEVAIIEPDEDALAHSDGMVAFIDDDVLLVNHYDDNKFREAALVELQSSFPAIKILEVPVNFEENKKKREGFSSACGINLNLVLTKKNLYVPIFNNPNDKKVLEIIKNNTTKKVIPIDASNVCAMGGSLRCLTWQVMSL